MFALILLFVNAAHVNTSQSVMLFDNKAACQATAPKIANYVAGKNSVANPNDTVYWYCLPTILAGAKSE